LSETHVKKTFLQALHAISRDVANPYRVCGISTLYIKGSPRSSVLNFFIHLVGQRNISINNLRVHGCHASYRGTKSV